MNIFDKKIKLLLSMIITLVVVIFVVGASYALFNYTKNGPTNIIKTGRMVFNTSQNEVNLSNVFPISSDRVLTDDENTDSIIISFIGDTTYSDGLEYVVTAVDVVAAIGEKKVPIALKSYAEGLGNSYSYEDYLKYRGGMESVNTLYSLEEGIQEENQRILIGYIAPGQLGINGTITIKAFIPDSVAISDTYDGTASSEMGTTSEWLRGRTLFTTSEWNAMSDEPLSFKIKIDAMEGVWNNE